MVSFETLTHYFSTYLWHWRYQLPTSYADRLWPTLKMSKDNPINICLAWTLKNGWQCGATIDQHHKIAYNELYTWHSENAACMHAMERVTDPRIGRNERPILYRPRSCTVEDTIFKYKFVRTWQTHVSTKTDVPQLAHLWLSLGIWVLHWAHMLSYCERMAHSLWILRRFLAQTFALSK